MIRTRSRQIYIFWTIDSNEKKSWAKFEKLGLLPVKVPVIDMNWRLWAWVCWLSYIFFKTIIFHNSKFFCEYFLYHKKKNKFIMIKIWVSAENKGL